jgi:hypothetical protein
VCNNFLCPAIMNSAPKLQLRNYGNYGDGAGLRSTAVTAIQFPSLGTARLDEY